MDPIPAPGAVPAVAGIDKVETEPKVADTPAVPAVEKPVEKPVEEKPVEEKPVDEKPVAEKPVEEKKDDPAPPAETAAVPVPKPATEPVAEPAKLEEPPALAPPADAPVENASTTHAPKPASVEEVPDKDGPIATTGVEEPKAVPSEQPAATAAPVTTNAPTTDTVKESVEEPIAQKPVKEPVVEEEPVKEPVIEKPDAVNGAPTKDVEMTGALNEAEPSGAGEREAAPQAIPPEAKTGNKRKADDLDAANGTNGTAEEKAEPEEKPIEKKIKTGKPGRPPTNGAKKDAPKKEKESLGHKVARNVKKVLPPVGKTARKTRSQGPA
ncbi:hypothetical protein CkaCkLH20_11051 [Colletotrichum karsti]|uniref:Uncharacterized protein n=1 Tax=Colletotrichum karsti TaxID=1095194 RepID=A0A9P6HW05_9PEZI|nr:uncharacterized protein CkaCkLH20_11051 [Colletotrichum karsti]KAF9871404.1 hypothetical protein CkaCkLH20_11051 [Colletotrichum karsti]